MKVRYNKNSRIIEPLCESLDRRNCEYLFKVLSEEAGSVGLDLSCVQDCSADFCETLIEFSKKREIGIFNITSDVFALFNIMNIDKSVNLFVNEIDFEENTRRLINRKFSCV